MDNKREVRKITSLADLKQDRTINVEVEIHPDMPILQFELKLLSYAEWMRYEREEPFPERVVSHVDKSGKHFDFDHPDWQQKLGARRDRVAMKRLASSITFDLPGDSIAEKADYLEKELGASVALSLYGVLLSFHVQKEATILNRRDSFQHDGPATITNLQELEINAETV